MENHLLVEYQSYSSICPLDMFVSFCCIVLVVGLIFRDQVVNWWQLSGEKNYEGRIKVNQGGIVESEKGVVAADDGRCSEIGASMLRQGGHAVDAAVAAALCLGVVYPMSSGIGGGAFMVVWSSSTAQAQSFDMRETAPLASSEVCIYPFQLVQCLVRF